MSAGTVTGGNAAVGRGGMFRSLRLVNYRVWFFGALVSNIGQWMESTAMSWVVLTRLTPNDASAMGIALALQFGPPLFLVGITGWVADRFDRQRLLAVTQSALLVISLTVGTLILTEVMTLPLMYVFCALMGCITAFDNPARQTFVTDIVRRDDASNAIALNSASFNVARLIGPAVAGLAVVAIGPGWVFIANATSFVAMLTALAMMRREELVPRIRLEGRQRFSEGFRYLWSRPDLMTLFIMVFLLGAFGMNFPIFASTMAIEFGGDADAYGLLSSILAIGALVASLMAAQRKRATMNVIIIAAIVFALAMVGGALAPGYWWYAVACAFSGFAVVTTLTTANAFIQTTTTPGVRGRVLAIYLALTMGGTFLGAPVVGWIAEHWGPRSAIAVAAAAGFISFGIGMVWGTRRRGSESALPPGNAPVDESVESPHA